MTEGDTILRAARRLDLLSGETVAASVPNPRGRAAGIERLDGRRLERVSSHGKNLLLHFDDLALHSHMGMNGSWHVYPGGARWRKPRRLGGTGGGAAGSGPARRPDPATAAHRSRPPAVPARPRHPRLRLRSQLRDRGDARRPARTLGDALLDQTLVAGIGNIFKSEACFAARLDPWRPVGDLDNEELRAVLAAARKQMLAAVDSGRHTYAVYRARRPCPNCGGRIHSRNQGDANRTTYWCPRCQG